MKRGAKGFDNCVVVVNPTSSSYDKGQQYIRQLDALFKSNLEVIEMRMSDYERPSWLITRLNSVLNSNTLLCIAGGDGTVNIIVDSMLRSSAVSDLAKQATILPLWAGNANDLAHMVNGNPPSSIESILNNGEKIPVYPLLVTTVTGNKSTSKLAVNYVSLGASAYASVRISSPGHRHKRIYRLPGARNLTDMASVTRAFVGAATFESDIEGLKRSIYDIALINGPRIAKVSRIPIKLSDKNFFEILIVRKHPLILSYLMELFRGITVERHTRTERSFSINDPTWGQIDGEAIQIPGNTSIEVKSFSRPFNILSTKIKL
ncbi:MAG: diacylglycerol/lipid kinase family protein [Candidatus Saccharimonadales bacterium]